MARKTSLVLLGAAAIALSAHAQNLPQVEIGYRWLDLGGNRNVYRSQVNERSGLLLRSFNYNLAETPLADYFRVDASDLGAGPAGALRLESGKANSYRLNLRYRRADAFSAIPSFALGQHTFDRTRTALDGDLELLRWSKFTPFIGYSWNHYDGPGTTTIHTGQDEFLLLQDLNDTDREIRFGTAFDLGPVQGQITQGWRNFHGRESLTLAPGAADGNNPGTVIGRPITAEHIRNDNETSVKTPFTNLYLTGTALSRIKLVGNYVRFASDANGSGNEDLGGSFASFTISRFFNALHERSSADARNTTWRGGARAEVELVKNVDLLAGWQRESRELSGSALINTLFLQSITFGGADPRDLGAVLDSSNSMERKEDVASVALSARSLGPFTLRGGWSTSRQDVTVTPDLSEIVVESAGGQAGTFARRVNSFDLDGAFTKAGVTLGGAWKRSNADDPILRTDFLHRDHFRLRANWQAPKWVRLGITTDATRQRNDRAGIDYDATLRETSVMTEVTPLEMLSLRASASRFRSDSHILFRRPENFSIDNSINGERGDSVEGGFSLFVPHVAIDGDLSQFRNRGTLPFRLSRRHLRVSVPLVSRYGVALEWSNDQYRESALALSNYDASRYGVYLRITP
jgi:hypothetical protein